MRILCFLLAILLLFSGCVLAEDTAAAPKEPMSEYGSVQSNLGQVNLRAKPSASSDRVRLLNNYDQARILDTVKGDDGKTWYYVDYNGQLGYIHGDYFQVLTQKEYALTQGGSQSFLAPGQQFFTYDEENVIPPAYEVPGYVNQLLFIAERELGYKEETSGVTKYGIWSGDSKAEWCAEYLCWSVYQTDKLYSTRLFNAIYPNYSGNNTGRDWFLEQGRYVARRGMVPGWGSQWYKGENTLMQENSYIPQPGDWIFLSTASTGDTIHVAMVTHCTYDENGTPNAMNAAWGGIYDTNQVMVCLADDHKTTENIKKAGAFTVSFATAKTVAACDYVGIVSANNVPDKFAKAGFHAVKSEYVNAPIIDEYPLAMECKVVELIERENDGAFVVGEIVNAVADPAILTDGKIDIKKLNPLVWDGSSFNYYTIADSVGKAWNSGMALK